MSDNLKVTLNPDGSEFAIIVPTKYRGELWRAYYTLLDSHKGLPIAQTERGDLLRKLGKALRGDT